MILDLFAGPDGWGEGARALGVRDIIGLEHDADACATNRAAGGLVIQADIETVPCEPFVGKVDGLIASPPCPDFSTAGKGAGIDGDTGRLMYEVPRWVGALRPRWIACEQVPQALEWWERFARDFAGLGYATWCGILNAADYGVPQTRRRAFLLASLDCQPGPPAATHGRVPHPSLFGDELLPWVSMAEALGWGIADRPCCTVTGGGTRTGGAEPVTHPRRCAAAAAARGEWVVRTGNNSHVSSREGSRTGEGGVEPYERPITEPAPTLDAKAGSAWRITSNNSVAGVGRAERGGDEPAFSVTSRADLWTIDRRQNGAPTVTADRPAPTVTSSALGHGVWEIRDPEGERVKLTIADALTLQSFRADYPVQGSRTSQFRQIGNAVPPLLARHVLAQVVGQVLSR